METEQIGGYKVQNLLQSGQSSQVYEVVEVASLRHFAMKILLPERAKDAEQRRLLFHEAEVGKKLAHPNIIKIHDINRSPTTPYFTMEFFPSGALRRRINEKQVDFIREHAEKIFKQTATGLAYMNASGWIHRDVKPDNVLVNGLGDVRIIDFAITYRPPQGMARWFTRRGKAQGTRSYMSPEQIRGLILDARADVYSYGITLYEVLTGRPPFRASSSQELLEKHIKETPVNPRQYTKDLTEDFAAFVLKMLEKKK
ncbi:MAG TPA: serine/threonine-protein kinase, partial [Gemmataceae bacterium]|nr:serine/threonine-protein kinase [Gemmataceae bacterium]